MTAGKDRRFMKLCIVGCAAHAQSETGSSPEGFTPVTGRRIVPLPPHTGGETVGTAYTGGHGMDKRIMMQPGYGLQSLSVDELGGRIVALARDIDFSASRMLTDMVSMGEIFAHVKERTEFGRYGSYTRFVEETGVSRRMAQYSVQAYHRFSGREEMLGRIGGLSKLIEVLRLPEGKEAEFIEAHDMTQMSVSEVRRAVSEEKGSPAPESKTKEPDTAQEIEKPQEPEKKKEDSSELIRAERELNKKTIEIADLMQKLLDQQKKTEAAEKRASLTGTLLEESKAARRRMEDELSSLRRQTERSGADVSKASGQIDGAGFAAQVRRFLSECCEVPQMGGTFYDMPIDERMTFMRALDTLDSFVRSARSAMNTIDGEAIVR